MNRSAAVARAFGAAVGYDGAAHVQRHVAGALAARIAAMALPSRPRVLDVGCGTGFLSAALMPRLAGAEWTLSDIAPAMVARARAAPTGGAAHYVAMDAMRPCFAEGAFDLVCSSLAAQWFDDIGGGIAALARLVAPEGTLALATLGDGSLSEWRAAHLAVGLVAGAPEYPDAGALARMAPAGMGAEVTGERLTDRPDDAAGFLRGLRAIGATVPRSGRSPLSGGQLRAVMRRFEAGGGAVTYHIAYCMYRRTG